MNTGKIITDLRDKKGWSQADLAEVSKVSRVMIGKYERGDAVPSIDAAKKIADAFGVSLDYLVGEGVTASFDKKSIQRLEAIEQFPDEEKKTVFALLDAFIRDHKAKQHYAI